MATPKKPARRPYRAPKKPPKARGKAHDWSILRTEYVTGSMSLRDLAAARGIHDRTVRRKSAADGWDAARTEHRRRAEVKTEAVAVEWRARTESEIHRQGHEIVLKMLAGAEKMAASMEDGSMKPGEMKAGIEAVKLMVATARTTAGLPADPEPSPPPSPLDGEIVLRRRRADGSETEVRLGGDPA